MFTRRAFWKSLGAAWLLGGRSARAASPGPLNWEALPTAAPGAERHYRADAQVLIFSIPILHRTGVGEGRTVWRESRDASASLLRFLEFTGYSLPARAAGLNRLGFIQEMSRVAEGGAAESIYFGLMTASPEETAEEARKSTESKSGEAAYTAIEGRIAPGEIETAIAHFVAPAHLSVAQRSDLVGRARQALATVPKKPADFAAAPEAAHPFLHSLAGLLRQPDPTGARFVYAGRLYRMWVKRAPDPKAAAYFRKEHLLAADAGVVRLSGRLRREAGGQDTEFTLWVEEGAPRPLPLRIEYRAKSYLRLTFEADA